MDAIAERHGGIFPPLGIARNRAELVAESIKAAILSGRLQPGEVLIERRVAEQLGVSKTPVREALIDLAQSGLVSVTHNKATTVRRLTFTEARHVYEERALLEPWAVANGIRSKEASFDAAERALEDARRCAGVDAAAERAMANRRFHRAMYSSCENGFITRALDGLQNLTALATTGLLWEKWPTWETETMEHQAIYEAARAGKAGDAAALMRDHIETSISRISAREMAG